MDGLLKTRVQIKIAYIYEIFPKQNLEHFGKFYMPIVPVKQNTAQKTHQPGRRSTRFCTFDNQIYGEYVLLLQVI